QVLADGFEILIGEYHATVACAWCTAVSVDRCAMQPDAAAVAAFATVPFIRIVERERSDAVESGELRARQAGGDLIDAERGFLVAAACFIGAVLAAAHV